APWFTSRTTASRPALAQTSAMREPIRPQPTTPTHDLTNRELLIGRSVGRRAAARREDSRRAAARNRNRWGERSVREWVGSGSARSLDRGLGGTVLDGLV